MYNKKGFTLIELLVVIAIIGLLSTLAVVSLNGARLKARDARRMSDIRSIQSAIELYKSNQNNDAVPSVSTWADLQIALSTQLSAGLPSDPIRDQAYGYVYCFSDNFSDYLIGANLEGTTAIQGGLNGTSGYNNFNCVSSFGVEPSGSPICANGSTGGLGDVKGNGNTYITFCLGKL